MSREINTMFIVLTYEHFLLFLTNCASSQNVSLVILCAYGLILMKIRLMDVGNYVYIIRLYNI